MITVKYLLIPTVTVLLFSACSKSPTLVDEFYGTSFELALQSQLLNPQSEVDLRPVEGVDGEIGKRITERYQKGLDEPAAKTEDYSVIFEGMSKK